MRLLPLLLAAVLFSAPCSLLGQTTPPADLSPPGASAGPPASSPAPGPAAVAPPGPAAAAPASAPAGGENVEAVKAYARGEYEAAARMLEPAHRSGAAGIQDRLILARAYLHLNRPDDAAAVLKAVLEKDKDNPEGNGLFGQLLLKAGKDANALSYLEHAYRLRPDPAMASALGRCHYALGNVPKAKTYLTAALQQDIRDPSNSLLLGRIHLERGSGALAEKYLLMAQEAGLESAELHLLLGRAYLLQEKALGPVLVKRLPDSPKAGDLVEGQVVLDKVEGAADQYRVATRFCALYEGSRLLAMKPPPSEADYMAASGWFAAGKYELADKHLAAFMKGEPNSPRAWDLNARLLLATKDTDGLRKALAAAKAAGVFDARAVAGYLVRAAAGLRAEGKRDDALAVLKQAEGEQPLSETVLRGLAALYSAGGKEAETRQYYARIIELFPDAPDVDELRNALKVLQEKKGVQQ